MKNIIRTDDAPAPIGPYSQAVATEKMLFCSGQISIDPKSGEVQLGSVAQQAELVLKNLEAVLKSGGSSFEQVIKTTIFLTDMSDFPAVNEVYGKFFAKNPPARSTIAVAGLPKGVKVEIEAIALR